MIKLGHAELVFCAQVSGGALLFLFSLEMLFEKKADRQTELAASVLEHLQRLKDNPGNLRSMYCSPLGGPAAAPMRRNRSPDVSHAARGTSSALDPTGPDLLELDEQAPDLDETKPSIGLCYASAPPEGKEWQTIDPNIFVFPLAIPM